VAREHKSREMPPNPAKSAPQQMSPGHDQKLHTTTPQQHRTSPRPRTNPRPFPLQPASLLAPTPTPSHPSSGLPTLRGFPPPAFFVESRMPASHRVPASRDRDPAS